MYPYKMYLVLNVVSKTIVRERKRSRNMNLIIKIIILGCVEDTHGNYSIIFASQIMTNNALSICKRELHADSTFRITPSKPKSYQLLVLHGIVNNHVCCYTLLVYTI